MPTPPPCTRLGAHCQELKLTLRVGDLEDDSRELKDAATTWLLGHTERITFGNPYVRDQEILVDVRVHVPCKYLEAENENGSREASGRTASRHNGKKDRPQARCAAHGFRGSMPRSTQPPPEKRPRVRRGDGQFQLFYKRRRRVLELPLKRAAMRSLPVLQTENPCFEAPCRTADGKRGTACCRDLTLDIVLPESNKRMEALLRSRRSPYLCKVSREGPDAVECEVITRCGYLEDDDGCALHDRLLPNSRLAKPSICREWPDLEPDEEGHPGCRLL